LIYVTDSEDEPVLLDNKSGGEVAEVKDAIQKTVIDRNGNTVEKCCKNCRCSYRTPKDDGGWRHGCDMITCKEIVTEEDCITEGYKLFEVHDRFIYGTEEEQEKRLLEERKKFEKRMQDKKNKEIIKKRRQEQRKEMEHLQRILFDEHYLDEVVRLAEKAGYIKVVHDNEKGNKE
jgi:hypothetical protein